MRRAQRTVFMRCYDPSGEHTCARGVLAVALTLQRAIFSPCNVSTKGVRNFDSSVDRFDAFCFYSNVRVTVNFFETQIIYLHVCSVGVSVVDFEANNWKHYRENRGLFDTGSREYQSKL